MFTNRSYIFLLPALVALFAVACQESAYINGPGQNIFNQDSIVPIVEPEPMSDPEGVDIPEGTLDVVQACDTCAKLAVGDTTKTKYYVKGWIVAIDETNASAIENFGNAIFTIATTTDERATKRFIAYQVMGKNGEKINRQEMVQLGDFVVIYGELMNYNGTAETVGKGTAYIYASNNPEFYKVIPDPEPTPAPEGFVIPEGALNVYQVRDSCAKLASGAVSNQKYYIYGWVKSFNESKHLDGIQSYGNAFFYMTATDDPNAQKDFYAYQCMGKLGAKMPDATVIQEGDFVLISAYITNYNGTYETTSGACIVSSTNAAFNDAFYDFKGCPEPDAAAGQISVSEAESICRTLENKATTSETYDIIGVVNSIDEAVSTSFGNATFRITDGKSFLIAYRCKGMDGAKFNNVNQVQLGDTVVVTGKLQNYNYTPEVSNGYLSDSTNPNL